MAIQIVTDSSSDITQQEAKEMGITVLPLTVRFQEFGEFADGIDLTTDQFFGYMEKADDLPKTSQVNFETFEDTFKKFLDQGDQVICILLSKGLSGTYQSAAIAKENLGNPESIQLVDSKGIAFFLRALVDKALALIEEGKTLENIKEIVEYCVSRTELWAVIEDLTYLKKGGRLSAASAAVGGLLGIKPIIRITDGLIDVVHKVRGTKAAYAWIMKEARKKMKKDDTLVYFAHGDCAEEYAKFQKQAIEELNIKRIKNCRIGTTVGTYTGPRVVALGFLEA